MAKKKPPAKVGKPVKDGHVVKAWMCTAKQNSGRYAWWTFDTKKCIEKVRPGSRFNPETDKWIRVLIVPATGYKITRTRGGGK